MKLGSFINYVQWWLQNVQKRMIHMQKSFFANIYTYMYCFFAVLVAVAIIIALVPYGCDLEVLLPW